MRRVRIDFAPPSLRRTLFRVPLRAWALLPAVLLLAFNPVTNGARARESALALERLQAEAQARAQVVSDQSALARAALPLRAPVGQAQAQAINAAVLQLNLPWRGLHDAIQAATPANIALLALEPDAKRASVRITAEARSSDDMLAYVARLQGVDWFDAVALARHEINEQDPNRPIRFQIDAQWKAAP